MINRREFLGGLTLAGTAGLLGVRAEPVAAEPPPEIATVRLVHEIGSLCEAPQYIAEELLQREGFTDVQYVQVHVGTSISEVLASGGADISMAFGPAAILRINTGKPIVLLSGLHIGCLELFGNERVRTIRDLKGKSVSVPGLGSDVPAGFSEHAFFTSPMKGTWISRLRSGTWRSQSSASGWAGFPI